MSEKQRRWLLALGLLALLLVLLTVTATAGLGGYRFVIGSGGGPVSQDGLVLQSAVGQPAVGGSRTDGLTLCGGFHAGACPIREYVFLPAILRQSG